MKKYINASVQSNPYRQMEPWCSLYDFYTVEESGDEELVEDIETEYPYYTVIEIGVEKPFVDLDYMSDIIIVYDNNRGIYRCTQYSISSGELYDVDEDDLYAVR